MDMFDLNNFQIKHSIWRKHGPILQGLKSMKYGRIHTAIHANMTATISLNHCDQRFL